jgi:acyl-CoA synthetase (AMP-forming)/AMP-acid ligase II
LLALLPQARFYNFFGPTETNVCTWYEVPRGETVPDPVPIGRAIRGDEARVSDDGELLIRGGTVMQGYWRDPERTAAVLEDGVYRTGDLVRVDEDGVLHFLGRRDSQVKSRGYRIELGEVERVVTAHPAVSEGVVLAVPDELVTNRLRAVVVPAGELTEGDLLRFCEERLPRYMVPSEVELRAELPKLSTGKVDRRSLAAE